MLPFLKKDTEASVSAPVEPVKREPDEGSESEGLHAAAQDLIDAVHAKDIPGVASAMRAALAISVACLIRSASITWFC